VANNLVQRPFVIDTPDANPLFTQPLRVQAIRWVGATTAGHLAIVQDQTGVEKWRAVAAGSNHVESDYMHDEKLWNGLKVPTLGSGVLYIIAW
jgi:arylamine N-acetyltransferase